MTTAPLHLTLVAAFCLVIAACGDTSATTESPAASEPPSTISTSTTTSPTTTTSSTTTTTSSTTTTTTTSTTTTTTTVPPTTTTLVPASAELREAMDLAVDSRCFTQGGTTAAILATVDGDLAVDKMISITAMEDGPTMFATGVLFSGATPASMTDDEALAEAHATLYMNHRRAIVALGAWSFVPFEFTVHYGSIVELREPEVVAAQVLARWGPLQDPPMIETYGTAIVFEWDGEERTIPFAWNAVVRAPAGELAVGEEARAEAWELADRSVALLEDVSAGDSRGAVGLEPLVGDLDEIEKLFCVLLSTEQAVAHEVQAPHANDPAWLSEHRSLFFREAAAQEALLAIEYARVLADHLGQEEIDWLRGDFERGDDAFDGVTSVTEYTYLWVDGMRSTLGGYRVLLDMATDG